MKLAVTVNQPQSGIHFKPMEEVHGRVELRACEKQKMPVCISIFFKGKVQVSLMPGTASEIPGQFPEPRVFRKTYILFDMSQIIFPEFKALVEGTREGQQQQNDFSADFTFAFPPHASCCSGKAKTQCLLPPSLDICSAGFHAKATYYINALACRPGLLKRTLRATAQLRYQPRPALHPLTHNRVEETDSTPRPEFVQTVVMLPASRLGWPDNGPCLASTGRLPAYSPALTLELLMPYPATLCLGRDTCLQILIHAGSDLLDVVGPLQLRSTTARLRRTTTSRAGGAAVRTDVAYRSLWHSGGAVPIVCEKLKVDCGMWQNSSGLLGINTLSFDSCAISREYAVEVVLGITSRLQPLTQYIAASINVVIVDPPPGYADPGRLSDATDEWVVNAGVRPESAL